MHRGLGRLSPPLHHRPRCAAIRLRHSALQPEYGRSCREALRSVPCRCVQFPASLIGERNCLFSGPFTEGPESGILKKTRPLHGKFALIALSGGMVLALGAGALEAQNAAKPEVASAEPAAPAAETPLTPRRLGDGVAAVVNDSVVSD